MKGQRVFRKGDRVPSVALRPRAGETEVELRPPRGPRVYLTVHSLDCDECVGYLAEVESVRGPVEAWGGDIVAIHPGTAGAGGPMLPALSVPILEDPAHVMAGGRLTVVIADEWGEVYFASPADGTHQTIPAEEIVEWVKFVSIQCPECEGPEGEWRKL
jgi:hypothetical protein